MKIQKADNSKLLLLSALTGLCAGGAAVILEKVIKLIQDLLKPVASSTSFNWLYLFLPAIGMLLSLLIVKFVIRDNIGHGVTKVLKSISTKESRIKPHNVWSSVLTSSLTIGFGGSVGAEAPIVYTGAAIGSNIGRKAGLGIRDVTILLGCGAAGAIAGIFKAPLAGILFTLEILMFNISVTSMMPLLISTVSATVVSYVFLGKSVPFQCTIYPFEVRNIPFYILLGVFCSFVSLYFQRTTLWMEDRLAKLRNPWVKWAICGFALGVLVLVFPPLYGEGYSYVGLLLNGADSLGTADSPLTFLSENAWGIPLFFALVLLTKVIAMTLTNAGGGVGGTFGPTLFVGAIAGFVFVRCINLVFAGNGTVLHESNFVLAGMAGAMAGVMQAPMTAIFLIAEITGGYELFLPLIISSLFSFMVTRIWERYSIYTKRLAQSGDLLTHDSDQAMLTLIHTSSLVRDKYPRVKASDSLGKLVGIISESTAAVIAVLDKSGHFLGYIDIGNVRKYLFRSEDYNKIRARDLMEAAPAKVSEDEKLDSVMAKFDKTEAWRLPVVNSEGLYVGFISRSRILTAYRDKLREYNAE